MDVIIHQSLRLRIMATLNALPGADTLDFTRLRDMLAATDGNLGAHLLTLEKAGYIAVDKSFEARKPRTQVMITEQGRRAFAAHVAELRALLAQPNDVATSRT